MATMDVSLVTSALTRLLGKRVPQLITLPGTLTVTTKRPELLQNETNTLNLFLYHICEDPTYKNQPIPGTGRRGVARTPMALSLFYIATPQHKVMGDDGGVEQKMMGALLKTFHDFPMIDADTSADGGATFVMPDALRESGENWLEIMLRPVSPEDALDFWASEQNRTVRLSAYYEVRAVFLEPETPKAMAGLVLSLGSYVSLKSAMQVTGTMSTVRFTPPASLGGGPQAVEARPGRVALMDITTALPDTAAAFSVTGSALPAGAGPRLVLRPPASTPIAPLKELTVDFDLNGNAWQADFTAAGAGFVMGPAVTYRDTPATTKTVALFPGTYMVAVEDDGGRSGFVPLLVGALVTGLTAPDPGHRFDINLSPSFDIARDNNDPLKWLDVVLIVDGAIYQRVEKVANLTADRRFCVVATPAGTSPTGAPLYSAVTVHVRADAATTASGAHPVRLVVEGVESNPVWLEVA